MHLRLISGLVVLFHCPWPRCNFNRTRRGQWTNGVVRVEWKRRPQALAWDGRVTWARSWLFHPAARGQQSLWNRAHYRPCSDA